MHPFQHHSATALAHEIERLQASLDEAAARAGTGEDPRFSRRAGGHLRRLSSWLDGAAYAAAEQAVDDACRVLDAAEPAAPLLMLEHSRRQLATALRRMRRHREAA